jgi:AAA ATPase domain
LPAPYICGNYVTDDVYFYGRQVEQDHLRGAFAEIVRPGSQEAKFLFVYGPKKVGKTSLVQHFIRDLDRRSYHCLSVYHQVPHGTSWSTTEKDLKKKLQRSATELATRSSLEAPLFSDDHSLAKSIRDVKAALGGPIVLAIDEAVSLFLNSDQQLESDSILRFRGEIQDIPGLLVVWIGPEGPARHLRDELQHVLLRNSDDVKVESLTPQEVLSLLRADKLAPRYQILITNTLAKIVHRLTDGNPYWVQLLGKYMWAVARRGTPGLIEYDSNALDKAKHKLFRYGVPFSDRIEPGLPNRILSLLAKQSLDRETLKRRLVDQGEDECTTLQIVQKTLEELQALGSVTTERVDSKPVWKISSPILAEYIIYREGE